MVCLYPLRPEDIDSGLASPNADRCILPMYLWNRILEDDHSQLDGLYLIRFTQNNQTTEPPHSITLSIGGGHDEEDNSLVFVPEWVFLQFEIGASVRYTILKTLPPIATGITIKPLDNALYCVDIAEDVSAVLSDWNVLQEGTIFQVSLTALGGYLADVYVEKVIPEKCVLLRGNVPLELAESVETVPEFTPVERSVPRPDTPQPKPVSPILGPSDDIFTAPMMSTTKQEKIKQQPTQKPTTHFIPFQGTGNRLGGK